MSVQMAEPHAMTSNKSDTGRYFEDFAIGQEMRHPFARTVTSGDCALYIALTGDRYPLYCDAKLARRLGYSDYLVNDLLTFHVVFGMTVRDISLNAIANLGYADVRFLQPVTPGDTLHATSTVVGVKENSNGTSGNVYVRTVGVTGYGDRVVEFYRWVMLPKRDPKAKAPETVLPDMPESVDPTSFVVHPELELEHFANSIAGGPWYWEDYEPGERVHHGPGMTIEEAEHAMATRLYHNPARVHFDGAYMAARPPGTRLVYGGHVISVARALAYTGFENTLRVLAWNSGVHANPTHAGDTLYAFTDVVSKHEITNHDGVGSVRLRLYAVKNRNPQEDVRPLRIRDEEKARDVFQPDIVLELDYFVMVPRRTAGGGTS